ncbi:hypothetical protein VC83_06544 [Pseudogymnoascus destructans]|uniref:Uncharacterized protein n=2 Tax=Pseudogymnoascus destructans TaxID=655981 RepID=L8G2U6_PSED2|nr:uncharacterized protein VC83_06544 [Pseudogymnoascus destructans]ELR07570.1 hypothetical protein GMDG_08485 [Pseudogymnoascus destructans 20631-21]OAF58414.1 hypothetical protein VC83_06544 [Pseudogymnoascus destructans]
MPGTTEDKNKLMANTACQEVLNRDYDESKGGRLLCEGTYFSFNHTCYLVIDHGPVDATTYDIRMFKWRAQELVPVAKILPYILKQFRDKYQFNPADRPKCPVYTDEQFRDKFGPDEHRRLVEAIEEKKRIAREYSGSTY